MVKPPAQGDELEEKFVVRSYNSIVLLLAALCACAITVRLLQPHISVQEDMKLLQQYKLVLGSYTLCSSTDTTVRHDKAKEAAVKALALPNSGTVPTVERGRSKVL
ncbi:hypothetical protein LXG23DRAFT_38459 [Yarrowia lipolytica]|nr:hypothetical protein LXG23DRAFT_38459 [Yarrowia lipolytica]